MNGNRKTKPIVFSTFLRKHKGRLAEILVCGLIVNLFALALPLFSSFVYDKVLGNGIFETLWAFAISLVLIAIVEFSVRSLRVIMAERFAVDSEADIDSGVIRSLLRANASNLPSIGGFLDRYKQVLAYRDFLSSSYLLALADLPFLALFLACIAFVAGPLVFVPITAGALMLAVNALTAIPAFDHDRAARTSSESRFRLLTDYLSAHEAFVGADLRNDISGRWQADSEQTSLGQSRARHWRSLGMNLCNSFSFLSYAFVIVGGAYMIEARTLTSGGLLAASMLSSRAVSSFASLVSLALRYRDFKKSLGDLDDVLPTAAQAPALPARGRLKGEIFLDGVTAQPGKSDSAVTRSPVLDDVTLRIQPGEMVGIAGAPGAGKTTLLRLIANVLPPVSGSVRLDHIPVAELSPEDVSLNIGYKPQDLCLVEGSIEDAVRAGRAPLNADERTRLLALSGLGWAFHHGGLSWTTQIGPRGTFLSGGQRQLVALARALHTLPPVLLLDEPTNGLSPELEAHLAQQLRAIKGHCTVLVSTHARSLLSICDRIMVVGQGRLLADGPREKILVNAS